MLQDRFEKGQHFTSWQICWNRQDQGTELRLENNSESRATESSQDTVGSQRLGSLLNESKVTFARSWFVKKL